MNKSTRRNHSAAFKAKIALEALKGDQTVAEIAAKHGIHPTLVNECKRTLTQGATGIFERGASRTEKNAEALTDELYKQMGQQKVQIDFLSRALGIFVARARQMSRADRRAMMDPDHKDLSVVQQCELLGLSRSSFYSQPVKDNAADLELMALIDRQFLETPTYGSRRAGHVVNRKRVRQLMRQMGLEPIWPKPNTSKPDPAHRVYPYLLRDLVIDRPNQVWATDITYIPMPKGFLYLVAIMDWHSRKILSWHLSNTLDTDFCVLALEDALARFGRPEIFNSDQGCQFTSRAFTGVLEAAGVKISMDGKGCYLDNVFVERLWRSLKYEDVYLRAYATGVEAQAGIGTWIMAYNSTRPHQALGYQTPDEMYFAAPVGSGLAAIPPAVAA
jgi:putative transposase